MHSAEVVALMLADGRLPTGGHTQSAGLEPAVRAGLGAEGKQLAEVLTYARDRLRTITRVEAAVAVLARHVVLTAGTPSSRGDWLGSDPPSRGSALGNPPETSRNPQPEDRFGTPHAEGGAVVGAETVVLAETPLVPEAARAGTPDAGGGEAVEPGGRLGVDPVSGIGVAEGARAGTPENGGGDVVGAVVGLGVVERAWAARTPSDVLRGVSRRQGRAYLRLAARVWPEVLRFLREDSEVARAVVVGVIGAVTGLSAEQVARVVAYDDVQTVVAASLKLLPVDPADAACWLAAAQEDIERLVAEVAPLTEIEKIPAGGAPMVDLLAQNHSTDRMRLFHA